jgi:hypothetical protein
MASVFTRRWTTIPPDSVLVNIESTNIIDLTPPAPIAGIGTGTVLLVGEFENGPFGVVTQVASANELQSMFGGFGFTYGSVVANYPCAPVRSADATITPEYWNGNAALALTGKTFSSLLVCRVDTSVGSVQFTALAYLTGSSNPSFALANGQVLALSVNGGGPTSATFTAAAATHTGSGAAFGSITAGLTASFQVDGGAQFTVTFQAGDTTLANVVSRINTAAGFTFASQNAGQLELTGQVQGTSGQVIVVSGGTALTDLGLTAATYAGTGNVANILQVQPSEVATVVQGAISGTTVSIDPNGNLRISNTGTPGTGTLTVAGATTAANLGFTIGAASSAATTLGGVIPAGTAVQDSGATNVLVTMQDVTVNPNQAGPYPVKVRYAVDNGTGAGTGTATIVVIPTSPSIGAFAVTNPAAINPALTETQIDAQYQLLLGAPGPTTSVSTVAKTTNILWCARHSNAIRMAMRANAIYASANGCFGRVAVISPPLNTSENTALGNSAPGVGATRNERVIYCYIGANIPVPAIALRGVAGGVGFNATGNIDQTSDGWMATILSQLNPEENPGQETNFTAYVNGIETGSNVQAFDMSDYIAFKAAGIAALRMDTDTSTLIFQSGVTSSLTAGETDISRRRMDDFIGDTIATIASPYGKKLMTFSRRVALKKGISGFLKGLLSALNPDAQRIGGYTVTDTGLNTQDSLALNLYKIRVDVQTLPSFDSTAVFQSVGPDVSVTVSFPQAA